MSWDTKPVTLDPNVTLIALRGLAANGSGWRFAVVQRARRARRVGRLIAEGALLLGVLGAASAMLYMLGG